ncbi:MAG: restriction endonuclease subunit S, partial [Methylococcaceae bacterium]|nr:restriction endonuclease subunit S [Methylococcaceae bacterium]
MANKYQAYAEYKDSGVEWLGDIPENWLATFLKRYCNVTDGSHHSPLVQSSGEPFISVTDVGVNTINFDDCKKITFHDYKRLVNEGCKPEIGQLLLTKDGTIG